MRLPVEYCETSSVRATRRCVLHMLWVGRGTWSPVNGGRNVLPNIQGFPDQGDMIAASRGYMLTHGTAAPTKERGSELRSRSYARNSTTETK